MVPSNKVMYALLRIAVPHFWIHEFFIQLKKIGVHTDHHEESEDARNAILDIILQKNHTILEHNGVGLHLLLWSFLLLGFSILQLNEIIALSATLPGQCVLTVLFIKKVLKMMTILQPGEFKSTTSNSISLYRKSHSSPHIVLLYF